MGYTGSFIIVLTQSHILSTEGGLYRVIELWGLFRVCRDALGGFRGFRVMLEGFWGRGGGGEWFKGSRAV